MRKQSYILFLQENEYKHEVNRQLQTAHGSVENNLLVTLYHAAIN